MNLELKILDLHWIDNEDNPNDLCAHGHVFVKIGNEVIADKDSPAFTVSSTALYLMRTIQGNYKKDDYASQLLPCCGHFFMADSDDHVSIIGCGSGIDWEILHVPNNKVKHISESGQEITIAIEEYKKKVFDFADEVEQFYKISRSKVIPEDDFDKNGYLTFWKEWKILRAQ